MLDASLNNYFLSVGFGGGVLGLGGVAGFSGAFGGVAGLAGAFGGVAGLT